MAPIAIEVAPLSFRIHVDGSGYLVGTGLSINSFVRPLFEMKFDDGYGRMVPVRKYRYVNEKRGMLYLPIFELNRFKDFLAENGYTYIINAIPVSTGKDVVIPMKSWFKPRDPLQDGAIKYIQAEMDSPLRLIGMQTGRGKTAAAIAAIAGLGKRAMICIPGMMDQWVNAIKNFTELTDDDIFILQGQDSLTKLLTRIDKSLFPKIIVASIPTLRSYASGGHSYTNYPSIEELMNLLKVGVRVVDEGHLNFHANITLDMLFNTALTVILSATFSSSRDDVTRILDGHYTKELRFGEDDYRKYVDIFAYSYPLGVQDLPSKFYRGKEGYSHARLENWLLTKGKNKLREIFTHVYYPLINSHYINKAGPGDKLLILCSTVEMCKYVQQDLAKEYPGKKSTIYISETPESELVTHDIIVSTPKSAGTGLDIGGLLTMFTTVSVRSEPLNKQMLGRLRERKDGKTPFYVYCYCRAIPPQVQHAQFREQILQPLGKSFTTTHL